MGSQREDGTLALGEGRGEKTPQAGGKRTRRIKKFNLGNIQEDMTHPPPPPPPPGALGNVGEVLDFPPDVGDGVKAFYLCVTGRLISKVWKS